MISAKNLLDMICTEAVEDIEQFNNDINRFDVICPECGKQSNSEDHGGNEDCFHCGNCGFVECNNDHFEPINFLKPGETKITDSLKKMI